MHNKKLQNKVRTVISMSTLNMILNINPSSSNPVMLKPHWLTVRKSEAVTGSSLTSLASPLNVSLMWSGAFHYSSERAISQVSARCRANCRCWPPACINSPPEAAEVLPTHLSFLENKGNGGDTDCGGSTAVSGHETQWQGVLLAIDTNISNWIITDIVIELSYYL